MIKVLCIGTMARCAIRSLPNLPQVEFIIITLSHDNDIIPDFARNIELIYPFPLCRHLYKREPSEWLIEAVTQIEASIQDASTLLVIGEMSGIINDSLMGMLGRINYPQTIQQKFVITTIPLLFMGQRNFYSTDYQLDRLNEKFDKLILINENLFVIPKITPAQLWKNVSEIMNKITGRILNNI